MENSTISASPKAVGFPSRAFHLLCKVTWYELLAVPVIAVAAAIFWFKEAITEAFWTAQERTTSSLGFGMMPLGIWAGVFIAVLMIKPSIFRHYRYWLASALLVLLAMGVMSLFRPLDGPLAWFTLDGYVSLGGTFGEAIAGPVLWQQILRLGALAVVAISVLSPAFAALLAIATGRLVAYGCIGILLISRAIGSRFQRKQRDTETERDLHGDAAAVGEDNSLDYTSLATRAATGAEIEGGDDYSQRRPLSKFAMATATAPLYIESTLSESADDRASPTAASADHPVAEIREREETDMQANTDFDFGFSHATLGTALADAGDADHGFEPDDFNGLSSVSDDTDEDFDMGIGSQAIEDLMDAASADSQDASEQSGLTVRLLGKNREQWAKPSIQMLESVQDRGVPEGQIRETAETIRQTLADYDIEVEIGNIKYGPTVTMYGIIPGWVRRYKQVKLEDEFGNPIRDQNGKQISKRQEQKTRVKVGSILSREQDLSLALRTPSLRIETPVMGKAQVGIEIPNQEAAPVTLRSIMESSEYLRLRKDADLPVALGKGTGGENLALDLAKMPHLLIAGATGSGKSVALNAIVAGLLMERSPAELRMLLVDPKRVELTPYNGIPHLLCPVIVEVDEVVGMLKGIINEMMNRYRQMEEVGVRNIEAYNKRMRDDKMPFLLVVVDELADLMMTAAFDVEQSLCRLAQLGRATGIHLILATQRPSVDVVTGLIKANFPSRISFGVTSHIDSRTILDTNGAEKLLGKGDMLYLPRDAARPLRAQGAFISDKEIDSLIDFWQTTPRGWVPSVELRPVCAEESEDADADVSSSTDALFDKAVELAYTQKKLSTSLLQRRLRIGYPRAARLMDELEENGVVSAGDGSKSRDVIIGSTV
jgi:DNA segregation ATPase FtsK/SpoIIIE-like protein